MADQPAIEPRAPSRCSCGQGARRIRIKPLNTKSPLTVICASVSLALGLGACASPMMKPCAAGQQPYVSEMLYFGTDKPGGEVSNEEWQHFVEEVVTPRFPQGLTVWPAYGQWRMASGEIIQEGTWVLHVMHLGEPVREAAIQEIMEAYKSSFQQEAVLRVQNDVCVSF